MVWYLYLVFIFKNTETNYVIFYRKRLLSWKEKMAKINTTQIITIMYSIVKKVSIYCLLVLLYIYFTSISSLKRPLTKHFSFTKLYYQSAFPPYVGNLFLCLFISFRNHMLSLLAYNIPSVLNKTIASFFAWVIELFLSWPPNSGTNCF